MWVGWGRLCRSPGRQVQRTDENAKDECMMPDAIDWTPRVWVGCLACYNEGRLVGDWFDAVRAGEVTSYDIHGAHTRADLHDELWCFDIENIPVRREMSPAEAAEWGELLARVDDHMRAALDAWIRSGDYVAEGTGELPSIGEFTDRYMGHYDSFRDYVESLAENTGLLNEIPEHLRTYFNWDSFTSDAKFDYTVCDADGGGVFVFTA